MTSGQLEKKWFQIVTQLGICSLFTKIQELVVLHSAIVQMRKKSKIKLEKYKEDAVRDTHIETGRNRIRSRERERLDGE